jgi:hypothetical protein
MNETFGKLENTMTYIKDHRLNMPPLTKTGVVGLDPPDETKTPAPAPTVPAGFDIEHSASGLVHITKIYPPGSGSFNKKQYSIIEVRFGLGGDPTPERPLRFTDKLVPASGDVLPHGELTRRAAHKLVLPNEKGNVLYIAVRYLSTTLRPGPWSDVVKIAASGPSPTVP